MIIKPLATVKPRHGQTFILVTHDSEVGEACDRVVRMRDGRASGAAR
jgi:putative ABC transport system ATP-binding protein